MGTAPLHVWVYPFLLRIFVFPYAFLTIEWINKSHTHPPDVSPKEISGP